MKFAKEKPTDPGFYWIKEDKDDDVSIVELCPRLRETDLFINFFGDGYVPKLKNINHILWGSKITLNDNVEIQEED